MSPIETAKVVAMLQAAYPAARWTQPTIDLYELMLCKLDYAVARDTVTRVIQTSKFLPSVSEVLDAACDLTVGPKRNAVDAWGDVGAAIRSVGYIGLPKFMDPIVAYCVRAMGWLNLCKGESLEAADRARFCELYEHQQTEQRKYDVAEPARLLPGAQREPRQLGSAQEMPFADLLRGVGRVMPVKTTSRSSGEDERVSEARSAGGRK